MDKESACNAGDAGDLGSILGLGRSPGESHGQRSLGGYSPWGHKKLDMTESIEQACTCKMTTMCQRSSGLWKCKG